jgi:Flp pilus assembly protein TadG
MKGIHQRQSHRQRGQELVELGIIVTLFIFLVGGVMEFGYAFMVVNMITHAARDGARLAASWADRGACQQINNIQPIKDAVTTRIATVTGQTFTVTMSQQPAVTNASPPCTAPRTTPTVKVNVNGCMPYIFNIPGFSSGGCSNGFKVNRDIIFDDELRG